MEFIRFSNEWIEKLKSSVDIVEIIGRHVDLKPSGRNFVGLCPFHDEKTPSFSVNQERQFFYCFGCNTGGNVINFIMLIKNLSFPEAVRFLARDSGISLPRVSPQQRRQEKKKQMLRSINEEAARYFYRNLRIPAGEKARQYLKKRGIGEDLARQFFLGYALDSWDGLVRFLEKKEIDLKAAQEGGLIIKGEKGYFDRFRQRIIFPICDHLGRFVGFGGRSSVPGQPKYLNTPRTALFNKGSTVYGLNWSKDAIKKRNQVIVVEGYTDYISLFAKGQQNVVALLGTAFSPAHAKLLRRFASNAVVAFDGDQAGEKAALRSINILSENGMQAKIAVLDSGEDPDRFVRSRSEKEVVSWLAAAVPFMEYRINRIISQYDLETREGKLAASTELVNILAQLDKAVEREEYIRYAAQRLRVSVQALAEDVGKKAGIDSHMAVENRHNNRRMPKRRKILGDELVEREVLRCLLHEPNVLEDLKKAGVLPSDFHHNEFRHLFSLILRNETDSQGADITEYLFSLGELKGSWQEYFQSFLIVLRKRRLQKIEEKLSSLENDKKGFDIRMELYRLLKEYYIVLRAGSKNDD